MTEVEAKAHDLGSDQGQEPKESAHGKEDDDDATSMQGTSTPLATEENDASKEAEGIEEPAVDTKDAGAVSDEEEGDDGQSSYDPNEEVDADGDADEEEDDEAKEEVEEEEEDASEVEGPANRGARASAAVSAVAAPLRRSSRIVTRSQKRVPAPVTPAPKCRSSENGSGKKAGSIQKPRGSAKANPAKGSESSYCGAMFDERAKTLLEQGRGEEAGTVLAIKRDEKKRVRSESEKSRCQPAMCEGDVPVEEGATGHDQGHEETASRGAPAPSENPQVLDLIDKHFEEQMKALLLAKDFGALSKMSAQREATVKKLKGKNPAEAKAILKALGIEVVSKPAAVIPRCDGEKKRRVSVPPENDTAERAQKEGGKSRALGSEAKARGKGRRQLSEFDSDEHRSNDLVASSEPRRKLTLTEYKNKMMQLAKRGDTDGVTALQREFQEQDRPAKITEKEFLKMLGEFAKEGRGQDAKDLVERWESQGSGSDEKKSDMLPFPSPVRLRARPQSPSPRRHRSRSPAAPRASGQQKGELMSIKDLQAPGPGLLPKMVQMQNVRLLSVSKVIKPMGKGKGKEAGKGKSFKGKEAGKGKDRGNSVAINVGDPDGYVATVMLQAMDVVPEKWLSRPLCNVFNVRPRVGQRFLEIQDAQNSVVTMEEADDPNGPDEYPYCLELCNDCASLWHVKNHCSSGDYVHLPMKILQAEEKFTREGEVYLSIFGYDRDRADVGPLRIWRHSMKDLHGDGRMQVWMLRNLRVTYPSRWSDQANAYVLNAEAGCCPDACQLTALERANETELANLF